MNNSDDDISYSVLIEAWQDYSSRVEACIYAIYYQSVEAKMLRATELEAAKIRYNELFSAWCAHRDKDINDCGLGNGTEH